MVVESILTVVFLFVCFQSYIGEFLDAMKGPSAGGGATSPPSDGSGSGNDTAPEGLEFLNFDFTPALFVCAAAIVAGTAGAIAILNRKQI